MSRKLREKTKHLAALYQVSRYAIMAKIWEFKTITSSNASELTVCDLLAKHDLDMNQTINTYYTSKNKTKDANSNKNKKRVYESDSESDLEILKPPQKKQKHNSGKEEA
eukprot:534202_1